MLEQKRTLSENAHLTCISCMCILKSNAYSSVHCIPLTAMVGKRRMRELEVPLKLNVSYMCFSFLYGK